MKKINLQLIYIRHEPSIMSNTNKNYNTFSIRVTAEMGDMLIYLQEKKLLNKTAIIRLAVAELYRNEKLKEKKVIINENIKKP